MLVTNVSQVSHRFVPPWDMARRYIWAPGETLEIPDDVAQAVLLVHGGKKLIEGVPYQVAQAEPAEAVNDYEHRQMIPEKRGPGRPPKIPYEIKG